MLVKSISALAIVAFAANAAASDMPYDPMMRMSGREVLGLLRRDVDNSAYQPAQAVCGAGKTCDEACGAGYAPCSSNTNEVHCYNPAAKQTCCPNDGSKYLQGPADLPRACADLKF
jgi:hypothetical protein